MSQSKRTTKLRDAEFILKLIPQWISKSSIPVTRCSKRKLDEFFLVKFHLKLNSISPLKVVFTCLMVNMVKIRFLHFNIQIQYSAGVHVNREIRFLVFCFYFSFILVQIRIIQVFCVRVGRVILNKIMTLNRRSYQYNEDDFSIYGLISDNFLKISTQLILVNQLKGPAMHVDFFQPITHECPQQISAQSIQQFGRLYATYIYIYECLVLLYKLYRQSIEHETQQLYSYYSAHYTCNTNSHFTLYLDFQATGKPIS